MGQRGKAHEVLESAKGSFAAALAVLPLVRQYYCVSGTTACVKRYYRSSGTTARERYYRLYAVLLESEWDSFRAGQTDLVRAKPTLWRLSLQV